MLLSAKNVSHAVSDGMTLIINYNGDTSLVLSDNLNLLCRCFHCSVNVYCVLCLFFKKVFFSDLWWKNLSVKNFFNLLTNKIK